MFEGGLNLHASRLRRQEQPIRYLVTLGALVTLTGASLAAYSIMDWDWKISLLFGSLVVVTGPTVVTPLLRDMRLRPRIKTILEAEGVLIDPIGAILAALTLQIALAPGVSARRLCPSAASGCERLVSFNSASGRSDSESTLQARSGTEARRSTLTRQVDVTTRSHCSSHGPFPSQISR